jgi:hypothetical protein
MRHPPGEVPQRFDKVSRWYPVVSHQDKQSPSGDKRRKVSAGIDDNTLSAIISSCD